ncbi:MAG TPA: carboxypeptidase-like regulatory domain-containing protein [Cytophagaceae bacterium]
MSLNVVAQTGKIKGIVKDSLTGEALISVVVNVKENTAWGGVTDFDGNYQINNINPGTYTLVFNYIGYESREVVGVKVIEGAVLTIDVNLKSKDVLHEVNIIAKRDKASEVSLIFDRKNSDQLVQSIGSKELDKVGASDAADGVKKVAGVSIVGSRFVVVRGLSDRYNISQLNGFPIASPNPDNRVIPFDIFPTDVIENLSVVKSFTPDLYADFSGASINIKTREYPASPTLQVGVSGGVNTQTTFRKFYKDNAQKDDVLGFNKTRNIPSFIESTQRFNTQTNESYLQHNLFQTRFTPIKSKAPVTQSYSLSYGDFIKLPKLHEDAGIGVYVNANYGNDYNYSYGRLSTLRAVGGYRNDFDFDKYTFSTTASTVANVQLRWNQKHDVSFNTLYTHLSSNEVLESWGYYYDRAPLEVFTRRTSYMGYSLFATQLLGNSQLLPKLKLNWGLSRSTANAQEPDRRQLTFLYTPEQKDSYVYRFNQEDRADNHRFYSSMNDADYAAKLGVIYTIKENALDKGNPLMVLSAGVQARRKTRSSVIRRFNYVPDSSFYNANPYGINVYDIDNYINLGAINRGMFKVTESTNPADDYEADLTIFAPYTDYQVQVVPDKLKINVGARMEVSEQNVIYNLQTDSEFMPERNQQLTSVDLFPSLTGKYTITKKDIARISLSKTISRPDFKEVAPFQYQPYFGSLTIMGNPNLKNAYNYNADMRYERFSDKGELIAIGAFGKYLNQTIISTIEAGGVFLQSFANAEYATVMGIELEARKNLGFISKKLDAFSVNVNTSLLSSNVKFIPKGSTITNERPLTGASPYLVNVDFGYSKSLEKVKYDITLAYNVFGRRLTALGVAGAGDIYELPVSTLNLNASASLGKDRKWTIKASAKNLLNPAVRLEQDLLDQNTLEVIESKELNNFKRGVGFSLGISYNFY